MRLPASEWLEMTGLILVGLIPFAALGIFLGHKLTVAARAYRDDTGRA